MLVPATQIGAVLLRTGLPCKNFTAIPFLFPCCHHEPPQPKVADFGLLKEVVGSVVSATQVVGTPGYVDPAYASSRRPAPASDVYGYGILMLEILTARDVVDEEGGMMHIRKWVS